METVIDETPATTEKLVRFDWAIKYLLRNKANFDILEGFLSELLKTSIKIQQILESESNKTHQEDKSNRVDILVTTIAGEKIIVEVQCEREWDYLCRILYGTSKVTCEYMVEGTAYQNIRKVISISIVDFDLGVGKDYLYHGKTEFKGLHYQDTLQLSLKEQESYIKTGFTEPKSPDKIFPEYYIIKVKAFKGRIKDKLDEWIYFLQNSRVKEDFNAQGLQSAAKKLSKFQLTPEQRRAYEAYIIHLSDEASKALTVKLDIEFAREDGLAEGRAKGHALGRTEGRAQGHAEGHAEGHTKGRAEVARKLLAKGMSIAEVVDLTGLTVEEIQSLKT